MAYLHDNPNLFFFILYATQSNKAMITFKEISLSRKVRAVPPIS